MSVLFYGNKNSLYHLIVKRPTFQNYIVITIFGGTGGPLFSGIPNCDFFKEQKDAIDMVVANYQSTLILEAEALIGMVENADHSYVLCFVTATKTTCKIPGGAIVKKVTDVSYITITLNGYQVGSEFSDFTVAHFHYYCDTYDITNCYPNNNDPNLPSPEFCWNRRWRQIFEELDLSFLCIVLLQGYTSTLTFDQYNISYIVRRSVLNPGVRYFARGLNDVDSPGNEVECELLFAKLDQPDEFWEHCWRRGSVPFYWETILSGASARIHINSNFCQGTIHYFQHLRKRFNNSTIFLLSLLQYSAKNPNAPENELYLQYQQTVAELLREGIDYVTFYPFDLNEKFSTEGKGGVVDLLSYLSPLAILSDFTTHERKQAGLLRVNCADSLDRTNLATFYYALLITAEWCRRVSLAKSNNIPFSPEKPDQYIPPTILDFLAKAFVGSGDVISLMYTNTPSIKTFQIRQFSKSLGSQSSDKTISVKRRLINVFSDPQRQENILKWTTKDQPKNHSILLDNLHISFLFCDYASSYFNINDQAFNCVVTKSKSITLVIPNGYYLRAIWVYQFPSLSIATIEINTIEILAPFVHSPLWCRYEIPYNLNRFLDIQIKSSDFRIGKIALECVKKSFNSLNNENIKNNNNYNDQKNVSSAIKSFNKKNTKSMIKKMIEKPFTFKDLLSFKRLINQFELNFLDFVKICIEEKINPWLFNAENFFLQDKNKCLGCSQPVENPYKIYISSYFQDKISFHNFDRRFVNVCSNCVDLLTQEANNTIKIEEKLDKSPPFKYQYDFRNYEFGQMENVSVYPYSYIVKPEQPNVNQIISEEGGNWPVIDSFSTMISLNAVSMVYKISITLKDQYKPFIFNVELNGYFQEISNPEIQDNEVIFTLPQPIVTKSLHLIIATNELIEIYKLKVLGIITKEKTNISFDGENDSTKIVHPKISYASSQTDQKNRMQTFSYKGQPNLPLVITILIDKDLSAKHLIFALYQNDKFINYLIIKTPSLREQGKISYIMCNTKAFDTIVLYHLTVTENFYPLYVSFSQ